ncbi:sugar ABC transporter permease [Mesorhizobium sp. B2-1-3A]|nr:sugar ABC transporter permease [Mesorhizobium sp. B2-1-3A]
MPATEDGYGSRPRPGAAPLFDPIATSALMNQADKSSIFYLVGPALVLMLIVAICPLVYTVYLSFHTWNLAKLNSFQFVGLQNYLGFFLNSDIWHSIGRTVIYVTSCMVLEVGLGLAIAFLFDTNFKGEGWIRAILILPMVMSEVVVGLIWRWIYNAEYGILNYFLEVLGFERLSWLTTPGLAMASLVITDVWQWTPLVFLVCLAGLKSVPQDSIEAARLDGANWLQVQWHVALPAIKPIIVSVVLLRLIDCFRFVDKVFIMTYGGPANDTALLGFRIYIYGFKYFQIGQTAAYSLIYVAAITVLVRIMIRSFNSKAVA